MGFQRDLVEARPCSQTVVVERETSGMIRMDGGWRERWWIVFGKAVRAAGSTRRNKLDGVTKNTHSEHLKAVTGKERDL